jgi:hypothetical protein
MTGQDLQEEYETYVAALRELRSAASQLYGARDILSSPLTRYHTRSRLAGSPFRVQRVADRLRHVRSDMDSDLYYLQARVWQDQVERGLSAQTFDEWRDAEFDRIYDFD